MPAEDWALHYITPAQRMWVQKAQAPISPHLTDNMNFEDSSADGSNLSPETPTTRKHVPTTRFGFPEKLADSLLL